MSNNLPVGKNISNAAGKTANAAGSTLKNSYNKTTKAASNAYESFRGSSTLTKIISFVILGAVIIALILGIVYYVQSSHAEALRSPVIISGPVNAYDSRLAQMAKRVPDSSDGLAFSYSFWIYVADWNYKFGQWKNILLKGNDNRRAPGIWLYPKTNALHARINTYADPNEGCDIKNIPLQKWVHIVYILNNRTVEMYIDGKLERSCVLRGVPILNNDPVHVGVDGGFFGQIARLQYFSHAINPDEVQDLYSEGPFVADRYNVNLFDKGDFISVDKESGLPAEDSNMM